MGRLKKSPHKYVSLEKGSKVEASNDAEIVTAAFESFIEIGIVGGIGIGNVARGEDDLYYHKRLRSVALCTGWLPHS